MSVQAPAAGARQQGNSRSVLAAAPHHACLYLPKSLRPDPFNPASGGLPLDAAPAEQAAAAKVGRQGGEAKAAPVAAPLLLHSHRPHPYASHPATT